MARAQKVATLTFKMMVEGQDAVSKAARKQLEELASLAKYITASNTAAEMEGIEKKKQAEKKARDTKKQEENEALRKQLEAEIKNLKDINEAEKKLMQANLTARTQISKAESNEKKKLIQEEANLSIRLAQTNANLKKFQIQEEANAKISATNKISTLEKKLIQEEANLRKQQAQREVQEIQKAIQLEANRLKSFYDVKKTNNKKINDEEATSRAKSLKDQVSIIQVVTQNEKRALAEIAEFKKQKAKESSDKIRQLDKEDAELEKKLAKEVSDKKKEEENKKQAFTNLSSSIRESTDALQQLYVTMLKIATNNQFINASEQYEVHLRNFNSLAQQAESQLKVTSEALKSMATDEQLAGMTELAKSLQHIESSNYHGAEAFKILEASNRAAMSGLADLFRVVDAGTSILKSYSLEAEKIGEINNINAKIVQYGKVTFDQLNSVIGTAISLAPEAKVKYEEVAAAISTITAQGVNAAIATTEVNALIKGIFKPSVGGYDLARSIGIDLSSTNLAVKGLGGMMKEITEKTKMFGKDQSTVIAKMFGDIREIRAIMKLGTNDMGLYNEMLAHMTDGTDQVTRALEQQTQTFRYQKKALGDMTEAVNIEFGEMMQKSITPLIKLLNDMLKIFTNMPDEIKKPLEAIALTTMSITGLGLAIGGVTLALKALGASNFTVLFAELKTAIMGLGIAGAGGTIAGATGAVLVLLTMAAALKTIEGGVEALKGANFWKGEKERLEDYKTTLDGAYERLTQYIALSTGTQVESTYGPTGTPSKPGPKATKVVGPINVLKEMEDLRKSAGEEPWMTPEKKKGLAQASVTIAMDANTSPEEKKALLAQAARFNAESIALEKSKKLHAENEAYKTQITEAEWEKKRDLAKHFIEHIDDFEKKVNKANKTERDFAISEIKKSFAEMEQDAKSIIAVNMKQTTELYKTKPEARTDRDRQEIKDREEEITRAQSLLRSLPTAQTEAIKKKNEEFDKKDRQQAITLFNDKLQMTKDLTDAKIYSIDREIKKITERANKEGMDIKDEMDLINEQLKHKSQAYSQEATEISKIKATIQETELTRKKAHDEAMDNSQEALTKMSENDEKVRVQRDKEKKEDDAAFDKAIKDEMAKIVKQAKDEQDQKKAIHLINISNLETEAKELEKMLASKIISEDQFTTLALLNLKKQADEYKSYSDSLSGMDKDRTIAANKASDLRTQIEIANIEKVRDMAKTIADPFLESFDNILPGIKNVFDQIIIKDQELQKQIIGTAFKFANAVGIKGLPAAPGSRQSQIQQNISSSGLSDVAPKVKDYGLELAAVGVVSQQVLGAMNVMWKETAKAIVGAHETAEDYFDSWLTIAKSMPAGIGLIAEGIDAFRQAQKDQEKKKQAIIQSEFEVKKSIIEIGGTTLEERGKLADMGLANDLRVLKEQEKNETQFVLKSIKIFNQYFAEKEQLSREANTRLLEIEAAYNKSIINLQADSIDKRLELQRIETNDRIRQLNERMQKEGLTQQEMNDAFNEILNDDLKTKNQIYADNYEQQYDLDYEIDKARLNLQKDSSAKRVRLAQLDTKRELDFLDNKKKYGLIIESDYWKMREAIVLRGQAAIADITQDNSDKIMALNEKNYNEEIRLVEATLGKKRKELEQDYDRQLEIITKFEDKKKDLLEKRQQDRDQAAKQYAQLQADRAKLLPQLGADFYRDNRLSFDTKQESALNTVNEQFGTGQISFETKNAKIREEAVKRIIYYERQLTLYSKASDRLEIEKKITDAKMEYINATDKEMLALEQEKNLADKKLEILAGQLKTAREMEEAEIDKLDKRYKILYADGSEEFKRTMVAASDYFLSYFGKGIDAVGADLYNQIHKSFAEMQRNYQAITKLITESTTTQPTTTTTKAGVTTTLTKEQEILKATETTGNTFFKGITNMDMAENYNPETYGTQSTAPVTTTTSSTGTVDRNTLLSRIGMAGGNSYGASLMTWNDLLAYATSLGVKTYAKGGAIVGEDGPEFIFNWDQAKNLSKKNKNGDADQLFRELTSPGTVNNNSSSRPVTINQGDIIVTLPAGANEDRFISTIQTMLREHDKETLEKIR